MPNGLKQGQMVERMFTELLGLDGKSGMKADVKETKDKIGCIEKEIVTKDECTTIRSGIGAKKDKYLMRIKDVILLILAILGFLWGSGVIR